MGRRDACGRSLAPIVRQDEACDVEARPQPLVSPNLPRVTCFCVVSLESILDSDHLCNDSIRLPRYELFELGWYWKPHEEVYCLWSSRDRVGGLYGNFSWATCFLFFVPGFRLGAEELAAGSCGACDVEELMGGSPATVCGHGHGHGRSRTCSNCVSVPLE